MQIYCPFSVLFGEFICIYRKIYLPLHSKSKHNNNLNPKTRKGTNKMKTNNNNNNNNRNENNAAKVAAIVENEGRILAAIKKGNHDTPEIIEAADMFTEYREFCEAVAALQIAGLVECLEDGYHLTEKGEYLTAYDNENEEAPAEIKEAAAEIVNEDETPAEVVEKESEVTTTYHHTTAARVAQVCQAIAEAVGVFSGSQYPAADMAQDLNRFNKWAEAVETSDEVNPAAPFWFAVRKQGSESGTREHCKSRCAVLGAPVYVIKVERENVPGLLTLKVRVSSPATAQAVTGANEKPDTRKQYAELKTKHPDALLLFGCGEYYETYKEDAETLAAAFGLTISSENGHSVANFPADLLSDYLPALIRKGHRVAICDQLENPAQARRLVRRGITETVKILTN